MKELGEQSAKLLELLKRADIDAVPVRDEANQLVLFFEDGGKFLISVDPRVPAIWLKGVHEE